VRFILNSFYSLLIQGLNLIIPILILPYVTNILSPNSFGQVAYASTIYSAFGLFAAFGLSQYATREVAKLKDDNKKNCEIVSSLFTFQLLTSIFSIFIYSLGLITGVIKIELLLLFNLLSFIAVSIDITWIYQGNTKFKSLFNRIFIIRIVYCISIFYFVRKESDSSVYYFITILSQIIINLSFWYKVPLKPSWRFNSHELKTIFKSTKFFFIYSLLGIIGISAIKILSRNFNGFNTIGQFEVSYKIILLLLMIPNAINNVLMPTISKTLFNGSLDSKKDIRLLVLKFNFILANIFLLLIIFYLKPILNEFFSKDYNLVFNFILILSPMLFLNMLSSFFISQYLIPIGSEKKLVKGFVVINLVTILLSLPMLNYFDSYGIVYSIIIGELFTFFLVLYYIKNDFSLILLWKIFLQYILPSVALCSFFIGFHSFLFQNILISFPFFALVIIFYSLSFLNAIKLYKNKK
jgi:O-antigen/teichoic acid export membrane protein